MISSLCAIVLSTVGQVSGVGPRCVAPPVGASDACVECYVRACEEWIKGFYKCDGDVDCIESAKIQYAVDLLGCDCRPAVRHVSAVLSPRQSEDLFLLLETRLD